MAGVLFEDIFNVKDIDPEGKKFDRVVLVLVRVDKRRSVDGGYCGPVDAAMFPQQRIAPAPKQHRICRFMAQYMLILLVMLMTVVGTDTVKVTLCFKVALEMSSRRGNAEPGILYTSVLMFPVVAFLHSKIYLFNSPPELGAFIFISREKFIDLFIYSNLS
ncbi:hypothetical protein KQX54_021650 [Cotesia glomerata]|uniref:Uncharacterized protein n=1 Tax=Cotesia glomerata TaxID=32391 RepID=A0AAV7J7Q2_COTGL|nr:hypothetical protein KQX54_021650 [Cotesia glomerata]